MTLKTNFASLILTGCLLATTITSCGIKHEKPDDAFDQVKEDRMMLEDTNYISKEIIEESMKTETVKKENLDEWALFKLVMEKKIRLNEIKIQEIKKLPHTDAGLLRKVARLEEDNNHIRNEMAEYYEEVKVKWGMFKNSINHEVSEIEIELNAMKNENK